MNEVDQLISEIREIKSQYEGEVSGARKTWPRSVRTRVMALAKADISTKEIHQLTDIPKATIDLWKRKSKNQTEPVTVMQLTEPLGGSFRELTVRQANGEVESKQRDWVVTLPGNIQIRGMDVESLIQLCRGLTQ